MNDPDLGTIDHHTLEARNLCRAYDGRTVVDGLNLLVPTGAVTAVVGANACGKSTLLRGLAQVLPPQSGAVLLDGRSIHERPTKEVAAVLGMLPQSPVAPGGHHGGRPRRPWPLPAPGLLVPPLERGGRAGESPKRSLSPTPPSWPTAASTSSPAASGSRSGSRWRWPSRPPAPARRADHLPRRRPPGRGARPAHRPQPRARHHRGARPARAQPRRRATPTTSSPCAPARSSPPARRGRS